MKKYLKFIIPIVAVGLVVALILTLTMCDGKHPAKKPSGDKDSSSQTDSITDITDNTDDSSDNSSNEDTSNDTSSGEDSFEWIDDSEWPDDSAEEDTYKSPIRAVGAETKGDARTVNVNLDKTVFKDFMSIGTNAFTGTLTSESKKKLGYNESYFELTKKQISTLNLTTARLLFCVDWMITDTEENPQRSDWQNNKDYKNYINGVYDFDNEIMDSVCAYLDVFEEEDVEVEFNFGWKIADRITKWFSIPGTSVYRNSAPRDLEAYGKAAAAILNELINERGYTCIKTLSFYNEPFNDYTTIGDKPVYYAHMINKTYAALKKVGLHKRVPINVAEHTTIDFNTITSWFDLFKEKCGNAVGGYTQHSYYVTGADINYQSYYDYYTNMYGYLGEGLLITEYLNAWDEEEDPKLKWNYSDAAQLISAANTGMKGLLSWDVIGGYANTLGFSFNGSQVATLPTNKSTVQQVRNFYNGNAIINNYIGAHSDVLYVDWTGTDIRTSAFKRADGEYTFMVEANGSEKNRNLTLNFSKALGKKVYKYTYDYNGRDASLENYDAIIPQHVEVMDNVGTKITDNLSKEYKVYIYTTAPPVKQVAFKNVWNECKTDESITLEAEMLDCAASDEIVWSVANSTGTQKGTISPSGVYTPASTAKKGDLIAIRAQLKSDKNTYSIALIELQ